MFLFARLRILRHLWRRPKNKTEISSIDLLMVMMIMMIMIIAVMMAANDNDVRNVDGDNVRDNVCCDDGEDDHDGCGLVTEVVVVAVMTMMMIPMVAMKKMAMIMGLS